MQARKISKMPFEKWVCLDHTKIIILHNPKLNLSSLDRSYTHLPCLRPISFMPRVAKLYHPDAQKNLDVDTNVSLVHLV